MFVGLCMQWLQSIVRLQADITKYLSSPTGSDIAPSPVPAKPTASVMPQIQAQPASITTTVEPAAVAASEIPAAVETMASEIPVVMVTASEIPVAMEASASEIPAAEEELESDEAETTLSADNSEVNVSLENLSKDSPEDNDTMDVEPPHGCSVAVEAPTADHCEASGCNDVVESVQTNNLSSSPDSCCCKSNNDVAAKTEGTRCSDYEAANVLSDMQQLANLAAFSPALSTSFCAVSLNTTSDARSAGVKTDECLSSLSPQLSSNVTGRSLSG